MKAVSKGNNGKVQASDKGKGIHNQEKQYLKQNSIKTNHDEVAPSGIKSKPYPDQEHNGFQLGTNPMSEDSFEKKLIMKEKMDREMARREYVQGIQGTDGGKKPYECYNINN